MMKTLLSLLLLCTFLLGCGYKKEKPGPLVKKPSPSSDGRNTFYCEINGVPYYQKFTGGQPSYPTIDGAYTFIKSGHSLILIFSYKNSSNNYLISFIGDSLMEKTKIKFPEYPRVSFLIYDIYKSCNYSDAISRYKTHSGEIFFSRIDPVKSVYSGVFNFKIWLPNSTGETCDTIKVTNGIFDLRL